MYHKGHLLLEGKLDIEPLFKPDIARRCAYKYLERAVLNVPAMQRGVVVCEGAAARLILALLYDRLTFSDARERGEVSLVRNILTYIQLHYREDVTRYTISRALGYIPEHISRVFNKYVKSGLNRYINALRISYINERLAHGDAQSLRSLIYEAGFNSEQTYYRSKALRG